MNASEQLLHLDQLLLQVDQQTAVKLGHLATLISYSTSVEELNLYLQVMQLLTRTLN